MIKKLCTLLALAFCLNANAQCTVTLSGNGVYGGGGYISLCAGITTTITASGATNYTWMPGGENTDTIIITPSTTTIYTLTANTGTCTTNNNFTFNVFPVPSPPVLASPSSNPIIVCQGTSLTISVTPTGTVSSAGNWYEGSNCLYNPYFTYTAPTNTIGTNIYTVRDSSHCQSAPLTITVTVNAAPVMTAIGATVCPGAIVPSPFITTNPSGGVIYSWTATNNINTGMIASGTGTPAPYTAPSNTTLINQISVVTYTPSLLGCNGPTTTDTICIKPTPIISFTIVADASPHTWDAYPTYPANVVSYSWDWGDGTNSTIAYPSHTYSVAGTYSICVTVTDINGCSATSCQNDAVSRLGNNSTLSTMVYINVINGTMGIEQVTNNNELNIYPNPSSSIINVELKMKYVGNAQYTLYDINGKAVKQAIIYNLKSLIDVSDLNEGVYNISIMSSEGVINKRIVIVK